MFYKPAEDSYLLIEVVKNHIQKLNVKNKNDSLVLAKKFIIQDRQ